MSRGKALHVQQSSELMELKQIVLKQQVQLELLVKYLVPDTNKPSVLNNQSKRTPGSRPICIRCYQPGYIARFC